MSHGAVSAAPLPSPTRGSLMVGFAGLLHRVHNNDQSLRCLRLVPGLFALPEMRDALLRNNTIRSVIILDVAPSNVSEVLFAKLLECLYHLPLRSLQAGGSLQLPSCYMDHVLHLVDYSCGAGRCCKWDQMKDDQIPAADVEEAAARDTNTATPACVVEGGKGVLKTAWKSSASLEFVDLSGRHLTESQASWLGAVLFHPRCSLRRVDLCGCRLGNAGLRALLQTAASSPRLGANATTTQLEVFSLQWNGVTEDGSFLAFLELLEGDPTCITCVESHGNYLSPDLQRRLDERAARVWPLLRPRKKEGSAEAWEAKKTPQRQEQHLGLPSHTNTALQLLLSISEELGSSTPSLSLLTSLFTL